MKLDEYFFNSLTFKKLEQQHDIDKRGRQIIISCEHNGIYRQYSFHFHPDLHDEEDLPGLEYQGKRIVAWAIDKALKQMKCGD